MRTAASRSTTTWGGHRSRRWASSPTCRRAPPRRCRSPTCSPAPRTGGTRSRRVPPARCRARRGRSRRSPPPLEARIATVGSGMDLSYQGFMSDAVRAFELAGVVILVVGSVAAFGGYALELVRGTPRLTAFKDLRASLGRSILLGLEVLVVADIVRTIVVEPTLESAATLGVIVLVRV